MGKIDPANDHQARFEALERENGLFEDRYRQFSTWRVMRNAVFWRTCNLPLARVGRPEAVRALSALMECGRLLLVLLFSSRRDLLVKTARSGLRMQVGQRFRDVYFDGLLERGWSYFKLEENNSPDFAHQARHAMFPGQLDPICFTFLGRVLGTLFPAAVRPFSERASALIAKEFGTNIAPAWLRMRVSTVAWQAMIYGLLLRRLRPRAVLVSSTGEYGLRLACRRAGVLFIELQHGVFNRSHPDAIPEWVEGSADELLLPDVLACRGAFWVEQLRGTRFAKGIALPVGDEMIDRARARREQRQPAGETQVVVTSQGLDTERLAAWLADMIDQSAGAPPCRISIKLHPVYDAETTDFEGLAEDSRVVVIGGSASPNVFDLLAEADLHLSIASACHFDAAALGVPSVVVPLSGHEMILSAVDSVSIFLARRPTDVWALADARSEVTSRREQFGKGGFCDNMENLLSVTS
jgi:hypothetical protein